MEKVVLIRHSMPVAHDHYGYFRLLNGQGIVQFIHDWNASGIVASYPVSKKLLDEIKCADYFISSNFKRTIESFSHIGVTNPDISELFNEAELPVIDHWRISLPFIAWGLLLRILWRFGYSHSSESCNEFKHRMIHACDYINHKQKHYKNVVVMAHGLVNFELRKMFTKRGFVCVRKFRVNSYYGFTVLEKKK
jgi:broad specificity phosphatase PhoE